MASSPKIGFIGRYLQNTGVYNQREFDVMFRGKSSLAILTASSLTISGCAATMVRTPLESAIVSETAQLADIPGSRTWGDEAPKNLEAAYRNYLQDVPKLGASAAIVKGRAQIETLALSGGGSDGAFGAGVLVGWTERGDRPEFEYVTGVSAGAIIAPFAYLGPEYDPQINEIWTQIHSKDLITPQIIGGLLGGSALQDTAPLRNLIARYIDQAFLKKIAAQYDRGRLLTIGTTNLDAKRPVVWNMGAIARHHSKPEAVELFRDVILASAAIPGLFPPVNIKVKSNGKIYDEMHVDGGVTRQIYVNSVNLPFRAFDKLYDKKPKRHLYLVHNGKMTPDFNPVSPTTLNIATQSIYTLMMYQHHGDVYRIYRMAKDDGVDFNSIAIPPAFSVEAEQHFDLKYQRALFSEGKKMGRAKNWSKAPNNLPGSNNSSASSSTPVKKGRRIKKPARPHKPPGSQPVANRSVSSMPSNSSLNAVP